MSDQTIEWGVLVRLPHGADDVEVFPRRGSAMFAADNINERTPGTAKLVYRTVEYGPWTADSNGDEWAVQSVWADGHVEVNRHQSRVVAESAARITRADSSFVVSRTVKVGDWWLAEVPA